jgi:triphosphatase
VDAETPFVGLTIVDGTMSAGQVALAVLRKHFLAMLAKKEGALEGTDPEELHDMRVATRRIRAAMSLFRPYLHEAVARRGEDFKWLGGALGGVRDLDVQMEHVQAWAKELPNDHEERLAPFLRVLAERRGQARSALTETLCTERYSAFAAEFGELLLKPPEPPEDGPILVAAPDLLDKRMRSFRKAAEGLVPDDPVESFHLARIRAKKMRYAAEFVAAVYGKPAKDAAARIVAVQDLLGLHQDCVVAQALVDEVVESERFAGTTMFALGGLRQLLEAKAFELRGGLPRLLKEARGKEWGAFRDVVKRAIPAPAEEAEGGEEASA